MDENKFGNMVRRLEASLETSPGMYRARVGLFAALGYVIYGALIASVLGLLGGMVAVVALKPAAWTLKLGWKLGIPLAILAWSLLKALNVSLPEPTGIPLTRESTPKLFTLVEEVRTRLKVPSLERVLLTEEFNASVVQLPRLGLFGVRNYLMLGLPLLQALSEEDIKAVLAHEFGHLSGNHSRFSGWVYRVVRSYGQVLETTGGNRVLEKFLNWYVPRLDAFSFPLRRRNEYEADAASAELVGRERAAQALVNVHVRAALNPDFWKSVKAQVFQTAHPPVALYHDWAARVQTQAPTHAESALEEALQEETGLSDTHPSLRDRLAKLGVEAQIEPSPATNAGDRLLGSHYAALVQQVGHAWSSAVSAGWQAQHSQIQTARQRLAELELVRAQRPLSAAESFEYADLTEDVDPAQDVLPLFRQALTLDPLHQPTRFAVARLLLHRDDAEGVPLMRELAASSNPRLRLAANALLSEYFTRQGDEAAAARSLVQAREAQLDRVSRQQAREVLKDHDTFGPHGVESEAVDQIARDLEPFGDVARAYLVQKQLPDGETPLYVLGIKLTLLGRVTASDDLVQRLVNTLSLPGETWCIRFDQNQSFEKRFVAVAGSLIYSRQ